MKMIKIPALCLNWDLAQPKVPSDNIVSSAWSKGGPKGSKRVFYPTYAYEGNPDMWKLVTFEYARVWQEERLDWEKATDKSDPKAERAREWRRKFERERKAEMKRRAEVTAKRAAETQIKMEQKAAEAKKKLEEKEEALKKKKEAEAAEKEKKRLAIAAQKKKAEALNKKPPMKKRPAKNKTETQNPPVKDEQQGQESEKEQCDCCGHSEKKENSQLGKETENAQLGKEPENAQLVKKATEDAQSEKRYLDVSHFNCFCRDCMGFH